MTQNRAALPRAVAAALAFLLLPAVPPAEAQDDRPRSFRFSRRDDALKARRPFCVPVEGLCPAVFGPPPVALDSADRSQDRSDRPLWRTLLGENVDIYAGVAFTPRTRYGRRRDGTMRLGAALGDPGRAIGLELGLAFFSTLDTGFGERMGLDLALQRLLPGDLLMSAGWENIATRGYTDIGSSRYVVLSRWFSTNSPTRWLTHIVLSAGVADGRFNSERDWIDRNEGWNLVGSAGVQLAQTLMLIAEWPGDDLAVGFAILPSTALPIVVTPAVTDITGSAGDGARLIVSITYVVRLRTPS